MTLPPLAPVSALEVRLEVAVGSLNGAALTRAEACLDDTSALIRDEAGKDWVALDGVTITAPAAVVVVATQVAKRTYSNPDGYTSESVGDYSWQANGAAGLYLTTGESRIVRRAARGRSAGSASDVRTPSAYGDYTEPGIWGAL